MNLHYLALEQAKNEGYIPYAGPYKPQSELWMIERAVQDIIDNGRDRYAIVKHGSQVDIYILPNYYLTTTFHGIPFRLLSDEDDIAPTVTILSGLAETTEEEQDRAETVWAKSLEEIAGPRQGEGELAQEVYEGEGGKIIPPEDRTEA